MLVPERCAPAMQIAFWPLASVFTQRPYRTTARWVRQGDCCVCLTRNLGFPEALVFQIPRRNSDVNSQFVTRCVVGFPKPPKAQHESTKSSVLASDFVCQ